MAAGSIAGVYVATLIYAEATGGPALSTRLNMVVLAALTAGVVVAALAAIVDRQARRSRAYLEARFDTVINNQVEQAMRLDENTGEISRHACPMLPADNVRSFELGRLAGRAARAPN
jgi:hypothetical protein